MKKNALLISTIVVGLTAVTLLSHTIDARRANDSAQSADEPLYVSAPTARRLSLAFNGLASDWYWMRSLQYVGGKIVNYEDTHEGRVDFGNLGSLNLELLPQLLQVSTALDPQFMAPYEYGAMILPELDSAHAIALLDYGIQQNPSAWRLYHHLGYIYWQRQEYHKASDVYAAGAKLPDAPAWMAAMSARLKGEGGSRDSARALEHCRCGQLPRRQILLGLLQLRPAVAALRELGELRVVQLRFRAVAGFRGRSRCAIPAPEAIRLALL